MATTEEQISGMLHAHRALLAGFLSWKVGNNVPPEMLEQVTAAFRGTIQEMGVSDPVLKAATAEVETVMAMLRPYRDFPPTP